MESDRGLAPAFLAKRVRPGHELLVSGMNVANRRGKQETYAVVYACNGESVSRAQGVIGKWAADRSLALDWPKAATFIESIGANAKAAAHAVAAKRAAKEAETYAARSRVLAACFPLAFPAGKQPHPYWITTSDERRAACWRDDLGDSCVPIEGPFAHPGHHDSTGATWFYRLAASLLTPAQKRRMTARIAAEMAKLTGEPWSYERALAEIVDNPEHGVPIFSGDCEVEFRL